MTKYKHAQQSWASSTLTFLISNCHIYLFFSILILFPTRINAFGGYSPEELEVYDLYDELRHTTFYSFLKDDLTVTATKKEIKSAYKKKALLWHPDKVEVGTDGLDKNEIEHRFRQLSQAKDILIDEEMRKTYDDVLKNGLPPGMSFRYYRYIMKMSVKQVLIFCFLALWLVHYLCIWGRYFEKQWIVADQSKRSKRKAKEMANLVIDKPNFYDTLPCLIFQLLTYIFTVLPGELKQKRVDAENRRLLEIERINQEKQALEEDKKLKEEREKQKKINQAKHQEWVHEQQRLASERYKEALAKAEAAQAEDDDEYAALDDEWGSDSDNTNADNTARSKKNRKNKNNKKGFDSENAKETGPWTDEERSKMLELMNKWPGGTPDRWGRIAEALNRKEPDVIKQLKNLKQSSISTLKTITITSDKKELLNKKSATDVAAALVEPVDNNESQSSEADDWGKQQQTALEQALRVFKKDYNGDRWLEISKCVQGKSKKDCISRYKTIALKLKAMKQN